MWLIGLTEPNKEVQVCSSIEWRFGVPTYLPKFLETYIDKSKRVCTREACLFPRYLFVNTDGTWRFLFDVMGMLSILRHVDCTPIAMPEAGIEELKSKENAKGLIELPQPLARRFKPLVRYHKGQKLRVTHGALIGYSGICMGDKGKARVWVLLKYLGRSTPVQIARDSLVTA